MLRICKYSGVILSQQGTPVNSVRRTMLKMSLSSSLFVIVAAAALLCQLVVECEAQDDCRALAYSGDCNFYNCLSTRFQCTSSDYPIAYGKRYCERFETYKSCFTTNGQTWIDNVRTCLMHAIVESNFYNSANITCDQLKTFAYESHPKCYADNRFCDDILVSPSCQNLGCLATKVFVWRDFLNSLAIDQIYKTAQYCDAAQFFAVLPSCAIDGDTQALIEAISDFLNCNTAGVDMIFVLDSSGSIGSGNFASLKNFVINMLSNFTIGPDDTRVGVIRYSSSASIVIPLGSSGTFSELSSRISSILYTGGNTYTDRALTRLLSAFDTTRIDEGVPRIAIVFTDGASHNPSLTQSTASLVHSAGIHTYSFGIGSGVNSAELNYIASGPNYVFYIDSFSYANFQTVLQPLRTRTCLTTPLLNIGNLIGGTIGRRAFRYITYLFPQPLGLTIKVLVTIGDVIVRGSFSVPNPTELTQDFVVTSDDGSDIDYFVSPELFESSTTVTDGSQQRQKRQAPTNATVSNLYLSIIGVDDNNTFSLNTTYGDTTDAVPTAGGPTGLASVLLVIASLLCFLLLN